MIKMKRAHIGTVLLVSNRVGVWHSCLLKKLDPKLVLVVTDNYLDRYIALRVRPEEVEKDTQHHFVDKLFHLLSERKTNPIHPTDELTNGEMDSGEMIR